MGKFMNPFTDVGFKHLFGREVSKELHGEPQQLHP